MKNLVLSILAAGLLLTAGSCSKTGSQGPQGPAGLDGNANVIGENSFTVNAWQYSSGTYYATYADDNITTDVANFGMVEIYKYYNSIGWTNLPDIDGVVTTVYNFVPGSFTISVLTTDGSIPPAPGSITFRAVIIPSSVRQANPHTNWKNYNETMAAINKAKAEGTY